MAIPGYENTALATYEDSEYYDWVASLVGIIGNTHSEIIEKIKTLRAEVLAKADFNILNTDGAVDLSKISAPTLDEMKSDNIEIVMWGDGAGLPLTSGYVNGKLHVFMGAAAEAFIKEWSLPSAMALIVPKLYISASEHIVVTMSEGIEALQFVATFMTKWGETGPSNNVILYADDTETWQWNCTLEIEGEDVPNYATHVRYYRYFSNTNSYRLVKEVSI